MKRYPKSPTTQCGEKNRCELCSLAGLTHLVNLHEFRVGARPFYGHLHDIRRRRHCVMEEVRSRWKRGSYCVDRHTCLYLMRNDKKKEVAQRRCKANLLHHFLFSLVSEKCSPWCLGTEATGAQPKHHASPKKDGGCESRGGKTSSSHCPRGSTCHVFRSKTAAPYHTRWNPALIGARAWMRRDLAQTARKPWRSTVSGRTHCPGSHGQEAAFI